MGDHLKRDWLTKEEAEAFIGDNSSFYLDKWKTCSDSTRKGWNWAAMFFRIEWMAYRKMYIEAVICFLAIAFISLCIDFILAAFRMELSGKLIGDAFGLLIGFWGNALYRKKALRALQKTKNMDEPERIEYLKAKGGVSILGVFGCIAVEIAYAVLFALLGVF